MKLKTFLCFALSFAVLTGCSQKQAGLFAIVVDPESQVAAEKELDDYARAIELKDGLKVTTIVDKWGVPDSIRTRLQDLYEHDGLVGTVFVGEIPIPMIRDAQYLTSAFKMEQRYPRQKSSVPSDRFYDDFSIEFDYIGNDEGTPLFYYSLSTRGEQHLSPDIFSGRIRPVDNAQGSKHENLKKYLAKATKVKLEGESIDNIFVFSGQGSLSESKMAYIDEFRGLHEHFAGLAAAPEAFRYLNYEDAKPLKIRVMDELSREGGDIAMLHHHGDYDTQYLGVKEEDNLTLADFDSLSYHPSCRFVILDACFNGAFQMEDCIADKYIFNDGGTVAVYAGSVNMVQDKWHDQYLGALNEGMNVGQLNQYTAFLETHIIGDPTFAFEDKTGMSLDKKLMHREKTDWKKYISDLYSPDVRSIALTFCHADGKVSDEYLLDILKEEPSALVRLQAFQILKDNISPRLDEACNIAAHDNYEMLQRFAVSTMGDMASSSIVKTYATLLAENNVSKRVYFNLMQKSQFIEPESLKSSFEEALDSISRHSVSPEEYKETKRKSALHYVGSWDKDFEELFADGTSKKIVKRYLDYMKMYLPDYFVVPCIEWFSKQDDPEIQKLILHALGWHPLTSHASEVLALSEKVMNDSSYDESVRDEALRTYKRLCVL